MRNLPYRAASTPGSRRSHRLTQFGWTDSRGAVAAEGTTMDPAFDQSLFGQEPLPLVLAPKRAMAREAFIELLRDQREPLRRQLLVHGGL